MGPIFITLSTTFFNQPSFSSLQLNPFVPYTLSLISCKNSLFFILQQPFSSFFMEAGGSASASLALLGSNNNGGGACSNESSVSKVVEGEDGSYEAELELGLGLSIGGGCVKSSKGSAWGECGRILTAKDFPSVVPQSRVQRVCNGNNAVAVSGTKRAAEPVSLEGGSPTSGSQVVGWPPIRAYRMNSLVNQAKAARPEEDSKSIVDKDKSKEVLKKKICNGNKSNANGNEKGNLGFVKVNMDGIPIGRKVDLLAHTCYETLAQTLEEMFFRSSVAINPISGDKKQVTKLSKLLDGSSDFVLTYEDKEGDWMLVGDVPWGMFLSSVKRFRIMRTSDSNGLAPRFQESNDRQRSKPV